MLSRSIVFVVAADARVTPVLLAGSSLTTIRLLSRTKVITTEDQPDTGAGAGAMRGATTLPAGFERSISRWLNRLREAIMRAAAATSESAPCSILEDRRGARRGRSPTGARVRQAALSAPARSTSCATACPLRASAGSRLIAQRMIGGRGNLPFAFRKQVA